jgi:hypothetical protein
MHSQLVLCQYPGGVQGRLVDLHLQPVPRGAGGAQVPEREALHQDRPSGAQVQVLPSAGGQCLQLHSQVFPNINLSGTYEGMFLTKETLLCHLVLFFLPTVLLQVRPTWLFLTELLTAFVQYLFFTMVKKVIHLRTGSLWGLQLTFTIFVKMQHWDGVEK